MEDKKTGEIQNAASQPQIPQEQKNDLNIEAENKDAKMSYLEELEEIEMREQAPDVKLDLIDLLIKDFLSKKFHVYKNTEYAELIQSFLEKNKPQIALFCHAMVEARYSGEKINSEKIKILIEEAKNIIENEQDPESNVKKKTFKSMLSPFSLKIFKKKNNFGPKTSSRYIGKKTKQIIEESLSLKPPEIKDSLDELNTDKSKQINYLLYKLSPVLESKEDIKSMPESMGKEPKIYGYIRSIDDLERIKERIRERKRLLARNEI